MSSQSGLVALILAGMAAACAKTMPSTTGVSHTPHAGTPYISETNRVQEGVASWYGPGFHGQPTASGATYDMFQLTAAHPTLPMGTFVQVTNLENHRTVEVLVNDRGPFVKGRIIDLSYAAARVLQMVDQGTAQVRLEILGESGIGRTTDFSRRPHYTLQLGSFTQEINARALKGRLDHLLGDGNARVVPTRLGSQQIYRVRVGRYARRMEAQAEARQLAQRGYVVLVVSEYP